jgi:subtilisin family serine protease
MTSFAGAAMANSARDFNLNFPHVSGQLIVKFKFKFASRSASIIPAAGGKEIYTFKSQGAKLIDFPLAVTPGSLFDKARELAANSAVEYVEANTLYFADSKIPDDPKFAETYGLHNDGSNGGKVDADVDAPEAWQISTGSKNVLVAVIDTGVDYNHEDLKGNIWLNPGESGADLAGNPKQSNGIDDDHNGFIDDFHGWDFVNGDNNPLDDNNHGSHVAGTIGAKGNNRIGVAGINWEVSIVGIKFLDNAGSGSVENAVKSVEYATLLGVKLTSNSWGGGSFSQTLDDAIAAANKEGILFVAAAGNNGQDNDRHAHYPASHRWPNVIAVGATDRNDSVASFSNYGKNTIHIFAPGVDIVSTTKDNTYDSFSGTSMATPHVAGVVALTMATYPEMSGLEIKERILRTAEPAESLVEKAVTGARLNAFNALENDVVPPGVVTNISASLETLMTIQLQWSPAGDDGDEGSAARYVVRRSTQQVSNESGWQAAIPVKMAMRPGLNLVVAEIQELPFNSVGFLTVRAVDNVGNQGAFAVSVPFAVVPATKIYQNAANSMDGLEATGSWGLQNLPDADSAFSDSPSGPYGNDLKISLTFPQVNRTGNGYILSFDQKYQLEDTFDLGYVEISDDLGVTWKQMASYTGLTDWRNTRIDLRNFLSEDSKQFRIRLRMATDGSIAKEGWFIDNIAVYAQATVK